MSTLEKEIAFLLAVSAALGCTVQAAEEDGQDEAAAPSRQFLPDEWEVMKELRLLEKRVGGCTPRCAAAAPPPEQIAAMLAESPLCAMYTGDAASPYTRFILGFYSSALYAQLPTKVNTAAVRLFQRFLCTCRHDTLRYLQQLCGSTTMEVVLRECLSLAGNLSSTVQVAAPTEVTGVVLGELGYDAHEVSPLDYLDVLLPHVPYLSQMCQQASLLLLAHEEMVQQFSSTVVLITVLFTIQNMGKEEDEVQRCLRGWTDERQALFYRMDAFLNCFT